MNIICWNPDHDTGYSEIYYTGVRFGNTVSTGVGILSEGSYIFPFLPNYLGHHYNLFNIEDIGPTPYYTLKSCLSSYETCWLHFYWFNYI